MQNNKQEKAPYPPVGEKKETGDRSSGVQTNAFKETGDRSSGVLTNAFKETGDGSSGVQTIAFKETGDGSSGVQTLPLSYWILHSSFFTLRSSLSSPHRRKGQKQ